MHNAQRIMHNGYDGGREDATGHRPHFIVHRASRNRFYASRRAAVMGVLAARNEGSIPPKMPMKTAPMTAMTSHTALMRKAKATCEKFAPPVAPERKFTG